MEFTEEFIKEQGFTPEQVTALGTTITTHYDAATAELKKDWDGIADKNTNGLLDGVVKYTQSKNGFELERQQGEKHGDYLNRFTDAFLSKQKTELEQAKIALDEKMKGAGTDPALKKEYEMLQLSYSELQKKEAQFDELNGSGIQEKYNTLVETNSEMTLNVAFGSVKPSFPETVNKFEAAAKWGDFKKEILKSNTLEQVDGEWLAINKENKYTQAKLSDLVGKDADITELMKGRQQKGAGGKEINLKQIEGVPFDVPENADAPTRSKLIKDYLLGKGIAISDDKYSVEFAALNDKIKNPKVAA